MSAPGAHRARVEWTQSLEIGEAVYRLALPLAGATPRLSEQLTAAAAALPPAVAQSRTREAVLALEALLELAVRLRALPEEKVRPLVARLDALGGMAPTAPAPAPKPPPAKPATPAPTAAKPPLPRAASAGPASPPERVLVDGSNFLGRAVGYALGDERAKERLLFRLQDYVQRHPAHRVTVFFDGQKTSTRNVGGIEERITSGLHDADDVVVDSVRALPAAERKRCLVVTDDRGLAGRVRNEGVRVESIAWLTARLVAPAATAARDPGMSKSELAEWEDYFKKPPQRPGK